VKGVDRCSINCEDFGDDGTVLRLIGKAGVGVHRQGVLWRREGGRYNCLISSDKSIIIIIIIIIIAVPFALYSVFRRVRNIVNNS
jgi:hypothetical protein